MTMQSHAGKSLQAGILRVLGTQELTAPEIARQLRPVMTENVYHATSALQKSGALIGQIKLGVVHYRVNQG